MGKKFNVTAGCKPSLHYMVDISSLLAQIKGYMLSFHFNKNKEIRVKRIILKDKILIEAVVYNERKIIFG